MVIDVSNPGAPAIVGTYNTPGDATAVVVAGNHAFVADGTVDSVAQITGPTVVALAARVGTTRLIDNYTIG